MYSRGGSFVYLLLVGGLFVFGFFFWPRPITVDGLGSQLAGNHCRYAYRDNKCVQRGFDPVRRLYTVQHDCDLWAVQCLGTIKSGKSVRVLVEVLKSKTDIENCNGGWPIRSMAVRYLGESGNRFVADPLQRHLNTHPMSQLAAGVSNCEAGPENVDEIEQAILRLKR